MITADFILGLVLGSIISSICTCAIFVYIWKNSKH